jgi:acyl-CoA thioesterase
LLPLRAYDRGLGWTWDYLRRARTSQIQADIAEYKAALQGELDTLKAQLEIVKSQPPEVNFNSEEEVVRNVVQSINDISSIVENQFKTMEQRTAELEAKANESSTKIEGLLQKASRPLPDRIKEIKALLKTMNDES